MVQYQKPDIHKAQVLAALAPMFKEAEEKGLWFLSGYQSILLSPTELRREQENGYFIWGPVNWTLVDPVNELSKLQCKVLEAKKDVDKFVERLKKECPSFIHILPHVDWGEP